MGFLRSGSDNGSRAASAHKACEHALQTQQGNRVHWGILVPFVARTVGGGDQHGWHALRGFVSENSTMQWLLTVSASLASLAFFWKIPWKIGLGKVVGYLDSDPFNVQQRIQTPNKRVTGVISPQNWLELLDPTKKIAAFFNWPLKRRFFFQVDRMMLQGSFGSTTVRSERLTYTPESTNIAGSKNGSGFSRCISYWENGARFQPAMVEKPGSKQRMAQSVRRWREKTYFRINWWLQCIEKKRDDPHVGAT